MQPTSIEIIRKLRSAGHQAFWAGGCVRDILLGAQPKDYDIVTSAKPEEIEKILERTIPVGKQFGVILAIENGHHFEVATFRSDAGYSDGRRPDAVIFSSAKEDALRRDFTINGLFYDPLGDKIIDYVGGQKDLDAKIIRFIGNPHDRIMEDHLRIMRAIRFKNELGFQYEPKTYTALHKNSRLVIEKVATERIARELDKMLLSMDPTGAFEDLEDLAVLAIILPEIQALKGVAQPREYHHEGDVWTHTMKALRSLSATASLAVRWAVLLHDSGKPDTFELKERIRFDHHVEFSRRHASEILTRLHYSRRFVEEVSWLVEHHMMMEPLLTMSLGKKRHWFLNEWFLNLMQLFRADIAGTDPSDYSLYDRIEQVYRETLKDMPHAPPPLIDGNEIMAILDLKPGKKVGEILLQIREEQLAGNLSTHDQALDYLQSFK